MAGLLCGATVCSICDFQLAEQIEYVVNHSSRDVDRRRRDVGYLERLLKVRSELPA